MLRYLLQALAFCLVVAVLSYPAGCGGKKPKGDGGGGGGGPPKKGEPKAGAKSKGDDVERDKRAKQNQNGNADFNQGLADFRQDAQDQLSPGPPRPPGGSGPSLPAMPRPGVTPGMGLPSLREPGSGGPPGGPTTPPGGAPPTPPSPTHRTP